jgi:hypothetical protein
VREYAEILKKIHTPPTPVIIKDAGAEFHKGEITLLRVTSGLIRRMLYQGNERHDICPKQLYETLLTGHYVIPPSESMIRGIYAETKLLGRGAYSSQHDLPKCARSGRPTSTQLRIDKAISLLKQSMKDMGMILCDRNIQIKGEKVFTDHPFNKVKVLITAVADLISPVKRGDFEASPCVIDLKLAKDIESTYCDKKRPWDYSPWADMEKMDKTQAYLYSEIFEMPFAYLVTDYKKNPGWDIKPIKTIHSHPHDIESKNRQKELIQSVRWVVERIMLWQSQDWPAIALNETCRRCPVATCYESGKIIYF